MSNLNIYGLGGHSLVVQNIAKKLNYQNINLFDDNLNFKNLDNYKGNFNDLISFNKNQEFENFIAIGDNTIREEKINILINLQIKITSLIDTSSNIADDVAIGLGSVVMPGCNINSKTKIGTVYKMNPLIFLTLRLSPFLKLFIKFKKNFK